MLAWELLEGGERGRGGKGEGGGCGGKGSGVGSGALLMLEGKRGFGKGKDVGRRARGCGWEGDEGGRLYGDLGMAHTDCENRLLFKHYV